MYRERLLEALKVVQYFKWTALTYSLRMLIQATTNVAQLIIRTCVLEYLTHFDPGLMMEDDYGYGDDEEAGAGQGLQISSKLGSSYM